MIRPFLLSTVLALFAALSPLHGQEELPLSIMEATSIGVGGYNLMDTYLTPGATVNYSGAGLSVLNCSGRNFPRPRMARARNPTWSCWGNMR